MNEKIRLDYDADVSEAISHLRETGVHIYGAGKIGSRLAKAFEFYEIGIDRVWDNQFEAIPELFGCTVTKPPAVGDDFPRDKPVFISIFAPLVSEEVKNLLEDAGCSEVHYDRAFINNLLSRYCEDMDKKGYFSFDINDCMLCPVQKDEYQTCKIFDDNIINASGVKIDNPDDLFIVRSMGLLITSKCNLTCVGCNHLRDHN